MASVSAVRVFESTVQPTGLIHIWCWDSFTSYGYDGNMTDHFKDIHAPLSSSWDRVATIMFGLNRRYSTRFGVSTGTQDRKFGERFPSPFVRAYHIALLLCRLTVTLDSGSPRSGVSQTEAGGEKRREGCRPGGELVGWGRHQTTANFSNLLLHQA